MSGTSGDGADAAAIELDVPAKEVRVLATASAPFPKRVRDAVLALGEGGTADAREIARLHGLLGDEYAALAQGIATKLGRKPDVIALHGQTIAHLPEEKVTFQIGDAARVAMRTGVPTVDDLRSADVATGRERFGAAFAKRLHDLVAKHGHTHDDALATATMLTARSIGEAMRREARVTVSRLLIAGGGARNPTLMRMLADTIAPVRLEPTDAHGVPAAYREAIAFAILGAYRLRGEPNTLPSATGAARPVSGGALHLP